MTLLEGISLTDLQSPAGWIVPLGVAACLAWLLPTAVGRLVDPLPRHDTVVMRGVTIATLVAVIGLWWWEVHAVATDASVASGESTLARWLGHAVLFALLAAATWVDLRYRVIPDAITVPGVLGGMTFLSLFPAALSPVVRAVPRSFAVALREPDVLGLFGPLHGDWATWMTASPGVAGLGIAILIFAGWVMVGTDPVSSIRPGGRQGSTRRVVACLGAIVIGGSWLVGGDHWRGTMSSLGGLAVAAGIIWLTRAGASRALGREAMGLGDVTLMAMVGSWLGWQPCILACFLAVFIGLTHGILQLVLHAEAELPFGPSLCLGAAVVVVAWGWLWDRTEAFFERPLEMAAVVGAVIILTAVTLWGWHAIRGGTPDEG